MSRFLGQVFLTNKNISRKIADYVLALGGKYLIEIGPGRGALTEYIYEKSTNNLIMVELDKGLCEYLNKRFSLAKLIQGDILQVSFADLYAHDKNIVFGNIPYYITTPIVLKFLREPLLSEAVFMVQREYYETMSAAYKSNKYSCMSVLLQSFTRLKKVMDVDRKQFSPVPAVDSTVVHLIKKGDLSVDLDRYSCFLRKCFAMPRKTL